MNELVTLSKSEMSRLAELETIVERGQLTFIEVGGALTKIRDEGLWKGSYSSFKEYYAIRWGWSKQHTYRFIDAAKTSSNLIERSPNGDSNITSEGQIRPLAILDKDEQYEAWVEANKIAEEEDRPVTGEIVKRAVEKTKGKEKRISTKDCEAMVAISCAEKAIVWIDKIDLTKDGYKEALTLIIDHCKSQLENANE
jgi:hypothetical protein